MRYKLGRGVDEEAPRAQICAAGHCDDSRLVSASTAGKTSLHTRGGEEIHKRFMTYIEQVLTERRRSRSGKDRPPRRALSGPAAAPKACLSLRARGGWTYKTVEASPPRRVRTGSPDASGAVSVS